MLSLTASKALLHLEHCCKAPRLPVVVYHDHIGRSNKYGSKRHVGISGSSIKVLSDDTHATLHGGSGVKRTHNFQRHGRHRPAGTARTTASAGTARTTALHHLIISNI